MKIVKIMGGLGNQMFQYAFGRALAFRTKDNVLLDTSWFDEPRASGETSRSYGLNLFSLKLPEAAPEQIKPFVSKNKLVRLWGKISGNGGCLIRENKAQKYDSDLLAPLKGNSYYKGYFQCPRYFADIAGELRQDFSLPSIPADDAFNQKWLKRFAECENPVFIHLRRGDYAQISGWMLPLEYYQKAVAEIQKRVSNPTFFVFGSECDDFIQNEFKIGAPFEVIGEENSRRKEDWKDIKLMMACKHAIIANSTFSWWAAWLSDTDNRIVISPSPFTNGDDILPDNWIKIKR